MSNIVLSQVSKIATTFDMADVDSAELANTLANTVFKGATNDQLVSLLIVANQYKLNPFTKEIYAFPAKGGGITPVVGVDGWARIINDNPLCDGIQFEQDDESCTCKIYRKDRSHPTVVTEYLDECRGVSEPWKKYPKRMLRHKALIQCARVAFGFSGIYDEDEARRIDESQAASIKTVSGVSDDYQQFEDKHLDNMRALANEGTEALQTGFAELPNGPLKKQFWSIHSPSLKEAAQHADNSQGETYEHSPA